MPSFCFRYGTMDSGKTMQLLAVAHNYEEQSKKVIIYKPTIDTRSATGKVESRTGLSHDCIDIDEDTDIVQNFREINKDDDDEIHCILIDEAQFLTPDQVKQLSYMSDMYTIPVIAYGLKNAYNGKLFEGSAALLYWAQKIEEIKNVCYFCDKKATQNLRIVDGKPMYEGNSIKCGDTKAGSDFYITTCNYHYLYPPLGRIPEK